MKHLPHITTLFFTALALFLTSSSCKDKNKKTYCEENPSECQTISVAKDYFYFKQGSWWVYEEETSHERDSMYVYESVNDPNSYYFSIRIHSELQDYNFHHWPIYVGGNNCSTNSAVESKCIFVKKSKGKPGDFIAEENCFYINHKIGSTSSEYSNPNFCAQNYIRVESILDQYQLASLNFGKTIEMYEYCSPFDAHQQVNCFYAQGVGLVRKELIDSNKIWNLVSYHIEP